VEPEDDGHAHLSDTLRAMGRFFVMSLPHTETTRDFDWCAYTSKCRKFCTMMHRRGHEVHLYGGEFNEAECTDWTPVVSRADQERWFGVVDPDINKFEIPQAAWDWTQPWWNEMNVRTADAIRAAKPEPGDFLCLIAGLAQKPIDDALKQYEMHVCEWGIGYSGVYAPFRAYESNAWRHVVATMQGETQGKYFDRTIPNFFDADEFKLAPKENYILFMGRLNSGKGPHIVDEISQKTGVPLKFAGQGDTSLCPHGEYLGVITGDERTEVMAKARAIIVPSLYLEPFGGVAVEAMLCGTPAITSDWGAFPETVLEGQTGFRCNMLRDFCAAVEKAPDLDPATVRALTMSRYSLDAVAPQFERWFDDISTLRRSGWYEGV